MDPAGTITDVQKLPFQFQAINAKGNATSPAGPLQVTLGDPSVLDSVVDPHDGSAAPFTGFIIAKGPLGAGVAVQMTDSVATAQGTVNVTGSAEAGAALTFGAPVAQ